MAGLDPELLKILVCPACKTPLDERAKERTLACRACRKAYPLEDGIPVLLIERARPL